MIVVPAGSAPAGRVRHATRAEPTAPPSVALDSRIRAEPIAWLTTVSADGRPHLVPIWFGWDGRTFLIFTKPAATKVRNVRSNPAVMLALGDPTADCDVLLVEGLAEVLVRPTSDRVPAAFFTACSDRMVAIGLSRDDFETTHSLAIRIRPTRCLGWAGRSHPGGRGLQVPG